jgi:hypothetical protein
MEFLKKIAKWWNEDVRGKKCTDATKCTESTTCCAEVKLEAPVAETQVVEEIKTGLPIENYIPQVEDEAKEVITMSPVSVTETPAAENELSPAEKVEKKKSASPAKAPAKKKKPSNKNKAKKSPTPKKPKAE